MVTLNNILVETANRSINDYYKKNSFTPGENGPHKHQETPVRNTAHWIITNLKAYEVTNDIRFVNVAKEALRYLHSSDARPFNKTFLQRISGGSDRCNGVIGQAWVIEALITAYEIIDDLDSLRLAITSFKVLPFDARIGLWRRVEVDGKDFDFDLTLNHQIWFAAAGSYLAKYDKEIEHQIKTFLDKLPNNIVVDDDGCFKMPVSSRNLLKNGYLFCSIRTSKSYRKIRSSKKLGKSVDIGYHAFHLYGLAMLRENIPEHKFWDNEIIENTLRFLFRDDYLVNVKNSKYGLGYNPPGFESAYSLQKLGYALKGVSIKELDDMIMGWLKYQVEETFNWETGFMDKVNNDPVTYAARFYEVTRMDNKYLNREL